MQLVPEAVDGLLRSAVENKDEIAEHLVPSVGADNLVQLLIAADHARLNAYAPYSDYEVGSSILLTDGEIVTGWNVENESYGASICAESSAISKLTRAQREAVVTLAVVGRSLPKPCGACRQRMAEIGTDFPVLVMDQKSELRFFTVRELLPFFDLDKHSALKLG